MTANLNVFWRTLTSSVSLMSEGKTKTYFSVIHGKNFYHFKIFTEHILKIWNSWNNPSVVVRFRWKFLVPCKYTLWRIMLADALCEYYLYGFESVPFGCSTSPILFPLWLLILLNIACLSVAMSTSHLQPYESLGQVSCNQIIFHVSCSFSANFCSFSITWKVSYI